MGNRILSCTEMKEIDMVDYLEMLGHRPTKIRNHDYWYASPLREEKEPSFKVNRKMNAWFDHGMGKGGNIIDFGILYHRCSVKDLLAKMSNNSNLNFSFQPPPAGEKKESLDDDKGKIMITGIREITSAALIQYLSERKIPLPIANSFCLEADFELYGKKHTAVGFKNDAGGYELRNAYFKGSSSPKDTTLIKGIDERISVFEGFFNFLSFQSEQLSNKHPLHEMPIAQNSFLILNSLSFIEKSMATMEKYNSVHLYLDRDKSGIKQTLKLLCLSVKYIDKSAHYKKYKDYNQLLVQKENSEKQVLRTGRHF